MKNPGKRFSTARPWPRRTSIDRHTINIATRLESLMAENSAFHIIIDDGQRSFWIVGPGGPNGVRLHYEVVRFARNKNVKLREHDIFAASQDAALTEVQQFLPDYKFMGAWAVNLSQSA